MKLNTYNLGLGGGSIMQLASLRNTIRMSYLIETPEGKVILIDGGYAFPEEANQLLEMIRARGNRVDMWILSHAHPDHIGVLTWLMENLPVFDIEIGKLIFHFPNREWLSTKEDWEYNKRFLDVLETEAIKQSNINIVIPNAGDVFACGGVTVEILNIPEDYQDYPSVNPTSMMFVVHFPAKDVLFMGDFDVHGQAEFLRKYDPSKLRCDVAQMAHHGQDGTDRSFYELIRPKYCLYNAPLWLYDNYPGGIIDPANAGKGPYTTLETRKWMEEMGAIQDFTFIEGDWLFT